MPAAIWSVTEILRRDIDDGGPTEPFLEADRLGEVAATFRDLKAGFGYGIQWE